MLRSEATKHLSHGEETLRPTGAQSDMTRDIKKGFVYERVPHVTLKSIANNEDIDESHAKFQPDLDKLRGEINKLAKQKWEEWEIPRDLTPKFRPK